MSNVLKEYGKAARTIGGAGKTLAAEAASNIVKAGVKKLNSIVPNKIKGAIKDQINKEEGVTESNDVRKKLLQRKSNIKEAGDKADDKVREAYQSGGVSEEWSDAMTESAHKGYDFGGGEHSSQSYMRPARLKSFSPTPKMGGSREVKAKVSLRAYPKAKAAPTLSAYRASQTSK